MMLEQLLRKTIRDDVSWRGKCIKRAKHMNPGYWCVLLFSIFLVQGSAWSTEDVEDGKIKAIEKQSIIGLTRSLIKSIKTNPTEKMWSSVTRLVRMGRRHGRIVTKQLEDALTSGDEKMKLAMARALYQLNDVERVGPVFRDLLLTAKAPLVRRMTANAIGLSPRLYDDEATLQALQKALEQEVDPATRISLARTVWRVGRQGVGKEALVRLMRTHEDDDVRSEAALVLAEMGFLLSLNEWTGHPDEQVKRDVYTAILNLSLEPTVHGERAFNLYRQIESRPRGRDRKMAKGMLLLRELLMQIRTAYPDQEKIDLDDLFEQAGKGMVSALDPFSQYMDQDDVRETRELLRQGYGGIGAYVGIRNNEFRIISPIYNSPAHQAGLRSMDLILSVDGEKTNGLMGNGGMSKVIAKLKGEPGTKVKVEYFRRGFMKPVEVSIVRDSVKVNSVVFGLLPGRVGYVRLRRFGERTARELSDAMDELQQKNGARAFVLDLRDNPGGLLRSGVEVADKFLSRNKLIVYSMGREDTAPRKDYYSTGGEEDEAFPLVVLVNGGAASASEIVAGALRDHKRGLLVGEKTYGKGSVQQIIPLRATHNQTQLRLTIAKYFLPSGVSIHNKGIFPEIKSKQLDEDDWVIRQLYKLRELHVVEDYVRGLFAEKKDRMMELAVDDGNKVSVYPGFADLVKEVTSYRIKEEDVRREVRRMVRVFAQDVNSEEFAFDLQEDRQLQRGLYEVLKKLEIDPASIKTFARYAERILEKSKHAALVKKPAPAR